MAEYINKTTDLVYSEDDKGWYLMQFKGLLVRVSPVYQSREIALTELNNHAVKWEAWY